MTTLRSKADQPTINNARRLAAWLLCAFFAMAGIAAHGQSSADVAPAAAEELAAIRALLSKTNSPITWVITGDSITHGASHTHGERSYPEHFAERVRWEMLRRRDIVINTGISGDTAAGILKDFDHRVGHLQPQVVSIMIGMNDCTRGPAGRGVFETNLHQLVHRVRDIGALPVLNSLNPIDLTKDQRRQDVQAYNDIVVKVAQAENVLLVDHWTYWNHECPDLASLKKWLDDPIHPNARGHREMARQIFRTLGIYDDKSPVCQPVDPTVAAELRTKQNNDVSH